MARPRKTTLDNWLDTFSEWNAEDRAFSLGQIQAIHRALTVAERRQPIITSITVSSVEDAASHAMNAALPLEAESDTERDRR